MRKKDSRVTIRFISLKYYAGILVLLVIFSRTLINAFLSLEQNILRSELETAYAMAAFLLLIAVILSFIIAAIRHYIFDRPIRKLSDAARRVAKGDFSVRVSPVRKDGKKDYIEVMIEDFNTMAKELESIETLKNDFIANVSHEIKTPLNVIQSYAASIQSDPLPDETKEEYAAIIVDASQKLSTLVTNILKLNKLENQEIMPVTTLYDLSEQLRCCALAFEDLWEDKDITFAADVPDDVIINYDASMLEIVWNNLLSNAVKFTNQGGSISLTLKNEDGFVVVSITDNGCGMDEATGRHIFDKFYQGDTSHSQQGNGLGLALVKRIVEISGGSITVDSEVGQGTTFNVRLRTK